MALTLLLSGCAAPAVTDPALDASALAEGFSATSVFPGDYVVKVGDEGYSRVLTPGPFDVLEPELAEFPSEVDGANIQIGYVRPDIPEGTQVPVIVSAGPYFFDGVTPKGVQRLNFDWIRLVDNFVPHGYAVAFVPVRGTADTGGCMDLMGPAERADLDAAVTWLGEQPWSNGNVGMIGLSYAGSTPWEVASAGNPHLKTIVPISGVSDWHSMMYRNGTMEGQRGAYRMVATYWRSGFQQFDLLGPAIDPVFGPRRPEHTVTGILCPTAAEGWAASAFAATTGAQDPTGFWAERNTRPGVLAAYNGSVFVVQGLQDWNVDPSHAYPWVGELEAKGLVVKHLLGQWEHKWPDRVFADEDLAAARMDFAEILLHWFDRWLKEDATQDLGPRVQVQDSSGAWRDESAWPPTDGAPVEFWLSADGKLGREPATPTGSALVAFGDPHDDGVEGRVCPACPTFTTDPFDATFRFAGIPHVHVTVTPSAPTQELTAMLYLVEGSARALVGRGIMDVAYADASDTSRPAIPGRPTLMRMVLEPLDVVVPAGASLQLEFHEMGFGDHEMRADPLPNLGTVPALPMQLEVGGDQSVFRVLAFERGPEAFFVPPGSPAP